MVVAVAFFFDENLATNLTQDSENFTVLIFDFLA
jgi:hypothetical protein